MKKRLKDTINVHHFEKGDVMLGWRRDCFGEPKPNDSAVIWAPHPITTQYKCEGWYKLHWLVPSGDEIVVDYEWWGSSSHGCDTSVFYDYATKIGVAVKDASGIADYASARKLIEEKGGKRDCCGRFPLV